MSNTFGKKEKLKGEKLIEKLFTEGASVSEYPLRLFYIKTRFLEDITYKTSVSVSKRNIKKAVDRNHIKRLLRESYRLNKSHFFNNSTPQYALMILYLGKDIPDLNLINSKLKRLFGKLSAIIAKEKEEDNEKISK